MVCVLHNIYTLVLSGNRPWVTLFPKCKIILFLVKILSSMLSHEGSAKPVCQFFLPSPNLANLISVKFGLCGFPALKCWQSQKSSKLRNSVGSTLSLEPMMWSSSLSKYIHCLQSGPGPVPRRRWMRSPSWSWDNFSSGLTATLPIRQSVLYDKNCSLEDGVTHHQSIIRPITFAFLAGLSPLRTLVSSQTGGGGEEYGS